MDNPYRPSLVQVYLEASSKDELVQLQFINNQQNRKCFNYSPPMKDGDSWVVWYYADILNDVPLNFKVEVPDGR